MRAIQMIRKYLLTVVRLCFSLRKSAPFTHGSQVGISMVETLIATGVLFAVGMHGFTNVVDIANRSKKNIDSRRIEIDIANDLKRFFSGAGNLERLVGIKPNKPLSSISGKPIKISSKELAGEKFFYKPGLYNYRGEKVDGRKCPKKYKKQCFSVDLTYTVYCLNSGATHTRCMGTAEELGERVYLKFSALVFDQKNEEYLYKDDVHMRYTYVDENENQYVEGPSNCTAGNQYPIGLQIEEQKVSTQCEYVQPTHLSRLYYRGPQGPTGKKGYVGPRGPAGPDGRNCAGQVADYLKAEEDAAVAILVTGNHQITDVSNGFITAVDQNGGIQTFPARSGDATSFAVRGGGCFVEGSMIEMANGDKKPIELLRKGDKILNGITGEASVFWKGVAGPEKKPVYRFETSLGSVTVTEGHPMYTDRGMLMANEVTRSDKLLSKTGEFVAIRDISLELTNQNVFNIELRSEDGTDVAGGIVSSGIVTGDLQDQLKLQKLKQDQMRMHAENASVDSSLP